MSEHPGNNSNLRGIWSTYISAGACFDCDGGVMMSMFDKQRILLASSKMTRQRNKIQVYFVVFEIIANITSS